MKRNLGLAALAGVAVLLAIQLVPYGGDHYYKVMLNHATARLSAAEKRQLVAAFRRLYATQPPPIGTGG